LYFLGRKILFWTMPMILLAAIIGNQIMPVSSETTILRVDPEKISGYEPGSTFTIDVTVVDVENLWGYQINLKYNTTVLTASSVETYSPFTFPWGSDINDTTGTVHAFYSMPLGTPEGVSGTMPLAKITFTVDSFGVSNLDLFDTNLTPPYPEAIAHQIVDGSFFNIAVRDIAITSVTASPMRVMPGESVSINVTIANKGSVDETFNLTASYHGNSIGNKTDISLAADRSTTVSFVWNTTGVAAFEYNITAEAVVGVDYYPDDNVNSEVKVRVGVIRDVAITNVVVDPTLFGAGEIVIIHVTVENHGDFSEFFKVTAYYNDTVIGDQEVINLMPGRTRVPFIRWITKNVSNGEYVVSARIFIDIDDNLEDNFLEGDLVKVGLGASPMPVLLLYVAIAVAAILGTSMFLPSALSGKKSKSKG